MTPPLHQNNPDSPTNQQPDLNAGVNQTGRLRITNANPRNDKAGTVTLRQLKPLCKDAKELPMYTAFEAAVRFEGQADSVILVGYVNRKGSTSYWGSRFTKGGRSRVIWEVERLGPLPGRQLPIYVEVLSFSLREEASVRETTVNSSVNATGVTPHLND